MTARFIVGDSLSVLQTLPDASVDLVLSSPPFLALRSYLPADHPDKAHEIGSEASPGEFIDTLLDITEECRRVLAPHGSLCFELGDTYSGSGGAGGDYGTTAPGEKAMREGQPKFDGSALRNRRTRNANRPSGEGNRGGMNGRASMVDKATGGHHLGGDGWPLDKSLCMIPESFRWALVYGRNPFNGRETPRWRGRNVVRWVRPNPPVGALGDKFRPATSDLIVACMSRTRYFDLDAVRTEPIDKRVRTTNGTKMAAGDPAEVQTANYTQRVPSNVAGAPPLDWWEICPSGYPGAHYATYPAELCVRPIKAMCPERVCMECGEPSRRISEPTERYGEAMGESIRSANDNGKAASRLRNSLQPKGMVAAEYVTTGWTDCGHDKWRQGVVLDPFAGSGTTLAVATGHGRDAIGIDLDERNADLARERVGMFLQVEHHTEDVPA